LVEDIVEPLGNRGDTGREDEGFLEETFRPFLLVDFFFLQAHPMEDLHV
jgi:hypothetical protein